MLLIGEIIFLVFGFVYLSKKIKKKWVIFTFIWLIMAPLPSVLSRDAVHAVRSFNMLIPLTLISAMGVLYLYDLIQKKKFILKYIYIFTLAIIFVGSFAYYLDAYFVHLPQHDSQEWNYGYKQLVETITPIQNQYKVIKVQQSFAQPYIYFLFYQKYDPVKYQKVAKLTASEYSFDVGYVEKLDNIEFAPIDWPQNKQEHGILVAADSIRIPDKEIAIGGPFTLVKQIKYLDGTTAFNVVAIK